MRTVRYELLRPGEILEEKERCSIAYLPVSPLEWHGVAMPYGTDGLLAESAARRAAEIVGGVVLPTLFFGTERHHTSKELADMGFSDTTQYLIGMDGPANLMPSFYIREEVFGIVVSEYLRLLVMQGYKLVVIVNAHGAKGQMATFDRLCAQYTGETNTRVVSTVGLAMLDESDEDHGHGTRREAALMMHIKPGSVDTSLLPPRDVKLRCDEAGIWDGYSLRGNPKEDYNIVFDPRDATGELGKRYEDLGVEKLCTFVREEYAKVQ